VFSEIVNEDKKRFKRCKSEKEELDEKNIRELEDESGIMIQKLKL